MSTEAGRKFIVGIGGTLRSNSSTERTVRGVLAHAASRGAEIQMFAGPDINLPMYEPGAQSVPKAAQNLIKALRRADGVVVGSPGYHGGISGLVKNALDYTEEMARDTNPYFTGRAIGCIATGAGWQGANSTLQALRGVAHALRGWPTSLGIAFNSREPLFNSNGEPINPDVNAQLELMAIQLTQFVRTSH
jgi:FMN reductase